MNIENKIKIALPYFIGFYQGYEQEIENVIESEVDYYETELMLENITSDNFEIKDFAEFKQNTARVFADNLAEKLKENNFILDISNITVDSPREYNFRSDYIFCEVPQTQIEAIKNYVDTNLQAEFAVYCSEHFKTRDGFISFVGYDSKLEYVGFSIENIIAEYPNNHEFIFEGYIEVLLNHFENGVQDSLTMNTFEGIRELIYENLVCGKLNEAEATIEQFFGE